MNEKLKQSLREHLTIARIKIKAWLMMQPPYGYRHNSNLYQAVCDQEMDRYYHSRAGKVMELAYERLLLTAGLFASFFVVPFAACLTFFISAVLVTRLGFKSESDLAILTAMLIGLVPGIIVWRECTVECNGFLAANIGDNENKFRKHQKLNGILRWIGLAVWLAIMTCDIVAHLQVATLLVVTYAKMLGASVILEMISGLICCGRILLTKLRRKRRAKPLR